MTRLAALAALAAPLFFAPPSALPPLPSLPSVGVVRLDVTADTVLVSEDVALPRGDWRAGDLDFYVAFGAPGAPIAFDARLLAVPDGALEAADDDAGEPVPLDRAPRRPATAHLLLGRPQMAGAILHVREAAFRRAVRPGGMAVLRIRSLLPLPPADANGAREVVVRLGITGATPLTLGRIRLVAPDTRTRIARADAHLCGPEADPYPLAVSVTPKPAAAPPGPGPVAPVLAVRHASDDLCVRFYQPVEK